VSHALGLIEVDGLHVQTCVAHGGPTWCGATRLASGQKTSWVNCEVPHGSAGSMWLSHGQGAVGVDLAQYVGTWAPWGNHMDREPLGLMGPMCRHVGPMGLPHGQGVVGVDGAGCGAMWGMCGHVGPIKVS
jgi:hypothetical protein